MLMIHHQVKREKADRHDLVKYYAGEENGRVNRAV